jgi:hypothetical protein
MSKLFGSVYIAALTSNSISAKIYGYNMCSLKVDYICIFLKDISAESWISDAINSKRYIVLHIYIYIVWTQGSRQFHWRPSVRCSSSSPFFQFQLCAKWIYLISLLRPSVLQRTTWYIANDSNILRSLNSVCDAFQSCREIVLLLFCVIYSRITCSITNTHSQPPLSNPIQCCRSRALSLCVCVMFFCPECVYMCEAFWIW